VDALEKYGLDANKSILFGGCIRDLILGGEIKDYDILSHYPQKKIEKALNKAGIEAVKGGSHLYVNIGHTKIQIGEKSEMQLDFSINSFKCSFKTLELELCEECMKDIEEKRLRIINKKDKNCFRRGIYMIYKYPFLKFTSETVKILKNFDIDKDSLLRFLKRKNIPKKDFYTIAKNWGLEKRISFLNM